MIPRISSGSSRAASEVEPTRSQNIMVSCRRSATSRGLDRNLGGAADLERAPSALAIALSRRFPWPEGHTELFEISVGEVRQDFCFDFVLAKRGFVLAETEVPQPSPDVHGSPS